MEPAGATRELTIVGAAANVGIRPYDGRREARLLDEAPRVLRELGLAARLHAEDRGDVRAGSYVDFTRPDGGIRNEQAVVDFSQALAERVADVVTADRFAVVIGGDCSIVLGSLLGAARSLGRVGLVYVDAHADFATPHESATGSAASMCLALAVGRGGSRLARMGPNGPLVLPENVALLGRRDEGQDCYGHDGLRQYGILDLTGAALAGTDAGVAAASVLERVAADDVQGFWIHVDADVFDPSLVAAVDSPEPGGFDVAALAELVRPIAAHPRAVGLQLTIYDPALDPERNSGRVLMQFLEAVLRP